MPQTDVQTASLATAGDAHTDMALRLRTMASQAANLGGGAVGAAGDPQAIQALAQACSNWSSALTALANGLYGVAGHTRAAATAYDVTDQTQFGGG
jgi:hypothetical protein